MSLVLIYFPFDIYSFQAKSKAVHDKGIAIFTSLKKKYSAKTKPKRLSHAIRLEDCRWFGSCPLGTIVERGVQLPVKVSRHVAIQYNCRYEVCYVIILPLLSVCYVPRHATTC